MEWFSSATKGAGHTFSWFWLEMSAPQTLQILSFETARTMSRLVALYKFLSDDEYSKFQNESIKAKGVRYLNSTEEGFLVSLACDEILQELESIAITVKRFSQRCSDSGLKQFSAVFANLKNGISDTQIPGYNSGYAGKMIQKMEKYASATSSLHANLEMLAQMELSLRKLKAWNIKDQASSGRCQETNHPHFEEKIAFQRKQVKHYREISLWNKTFDKSVGPMAKIIYTIYIRICELFGSFVPDLPRFPKPNARHRHEHHPRVHPELDHCLLSDKYIYIDQHRQVSKSGPILKCSPPVVPSHFHSQELSSLKNGFFRETEKKQKVIESAPPSTVGYAGLATRYADIIVLAQQYLNSTTNINDDARGSVYEMLPSNLKGRVRRKLGSRLNREDGENGDQALAAGWRDALEEILGWLAPMAHDTVQWQTERSMEKQRFDAKPTVLLFQTLHFSNLEKTEAAIVDVLVGLCCIYRYENKRAPRGCGRGRDNCGFPS